MEKQSYRSIFPKIESVYFVTRLAAFVAAVLWLVKWGVLLDQSVALLVLSVVFLAQTVYFRLRNTRLGGGQDPQFLASLVLDTLIISAVVYLTGGIESDFYMLYYLTIAFGAYVYGLQPGLILSLAVTTMYVLLSARSIDHGTIFTVVFRIAFAWSLALGVGVVADHMKHSAMKLLKLLDTLNVRTTELEQTQSQIENIHHNAGTLGEILDLQQVVEKILDIADTLWGYSLFELILVNPESGALERVAALENGKKRVFTQRELVPQASVIGQVARSGRAERIVDVRSLTGYIARVEGIRSQMAVPMVSRGRVVGVINAEARATGKFSDMDQKLVSIFAASAAMAVDNARLHKQVSDLAVIDELTGAFNYRYFTTRLEEERKRSERYGLPISLIMIDVDWFKKMNDTYGHEVGNMVLRELSRVIKECIRDTDLLCRYGGEEFIVILPQTASTDALPIGERIRERVDAHTFGGYGGAPILRATVSVGVTSYPDNGMQVSDLISAVDSALYRAKGSGKNLVCSV